MQTTAHHRFRPAFSTFPLRISLILAFLAFPLLCSSATEDEIPPMPEGFASEDEVKAAFAQGKIKIVDAANVEVPEGVIEKRNIEYGKVGDRSLELDLYLPENNDGLIPGLLFIHGGAWKSGSREIMKYYTVRYAKRGYACATISYRLAQEAPFPAAVNDAKCAVRWMRANAAKFKIDPDRIGAIGGSAGAHLAMMVGYSHDVPKLEGNGGHEGVSSRVQAVVNFYGPVDLTTDFARRQGAVPNFLQGKTYEEDPELYKFASPITHLTEDDPPTLILHGTIDGVVPIHQADLLAQKLDKLGIPFVYEKFVGWPHAMDLAEAVNLRGQYLVNQFLEKHLGKK